MSKFTKQDKVSIRLESGGHSFSEAELTEAVASGKGVEVVVITPRTTLMPTEAAISPEEALRAAGIVPQMGECVVQSESVDGRVAVMVVDAEQHHRLAEMLGERLAYASPLCDVDIEREGVSMMLCGKTLYMHIVADGVLRFAEALIAENDADILYYLERCNEVYLIYNKTAYINGDYRRVKPLAERVFKSVVCE